MRIRFFARMAKELKERGWETFKESERDLIDSCPDRTQIYRTNHDLNFYKDWSDAYITRSHALPRNDDLYAGDFKMAHESVIKNLPIR